LGEESIVRAADIEFINNYLIRIFRINKNIYGNVFGALEYFLMGVNESKKKTGLSQCLQFFEDVNSYETLSSFEWRNKRMKYI